MGDCKVLFLQIPGGTRPSQAGPMFEYDILKIGIGPVVCGYKHDRCIPLNLISYGDNNCVLGFH